MTTDLRNTITRTVEEIRRFQPDGLNEARTKAALIEPILANLGWAIHDPDEVHREFRHVSKDDPVDYALFLHKTPRLFVEAKSLGESLSDQRWVKQLLGYAVVAGVEWCVLTNGDEYRFYNAGAPVPAEDRLFERIRLSTSPMADSVETLELISRSNMEKPDLEDRWITHQVRTAIRHLLETRDKQLVPLIQKRCSKLTPKQIVASLSRVAVQIDSGGQPGKSTADFPPLQSELTEEQIISLAPQWQAGESIHKLAKEAGVTWQTLAGHFIAKGFKKKP